MMFPLLYIGNPELLNTHLILSTLISKQTFYSVIQNWCYSLRVTLIPRKGRVNCA